MRNPYVIGPYVTDHRHYGRLELQHYLLSGGGSAHWVIGNRRIGKTSLLRQLERRALSEGHFVPLFWDMQGCNTFKPLGQYLSDAVHGRRAAIETLGLSPDIFHEEDALALLTTLRRAALRADREILLLCDETEVLLRIAENEPELAQQLHGLLTGGMGLRSVMTSTRAIYRMHDVCRDWPTSPFLFGFDMSQTLGSLSPRCAHDLVAQSQAPEDERVQAASEGVDAICEYTNSHPYLLQLLCWRLFDDEGRLRPVQEEDLEPDVMLNGFFKHDFSSLTEAERRLIGIVHSQGMLEEHALPQALAEAPGEVHQRVHNLERLGYLRKVYGQLAIGNQFFANWLTLEQPRLASAPTATTSESALRTVLERQQIQEERFLLARLNDRRARLVELELLRAEQLLDTPPAALVEIEQLQGELAHLRQLLTEIKSN